MPNNNPFENNNNDNVKEQNQLFNDLPKEENNAEQASEPKKPIIEIPQEYYDKLEKEKQEKEEQIRIVNEQKEEIKNSGKSVSSILPIFVIINILVFYFSLSFMLSKNHIFLLVIPIYIIVISILFALSHKKNSDIPLSIMLGGILGAAGTFALSVVSNEEAELFSYYAIALGITGILGYFTSSLITNAISDYKRIKALQTIGIILYFVALFGVPYYLYTNQKELFYKYVFQEQTDVVAETEEEFIVKTLKNRYGVNFTCEDKAKHQINQSHERLTIRTCKDPNGKEVKVQSTEYDINKIQYTIQDDYLNVKYLDELKSTIETAIKNVTGANSVNISLYPDMNCNFIGDCADCDEYYKVYEKINNRDELYNVSSSLNFQKQMTDTSSNFVNQFNFKYIVTINGNYASLDANAYSKLIENALNQMNASSIKNNYGYEIIIKNANDLNNSTVYNKAVYKVKGQSSNDKTFKDPVVEDINK